MITKSMRDIMVLYPINTILSNSTAQSRGKIIIILW